MRNAALQQELKAAGIAVMKGGVSTTTMKEALKAHANGDDKLSIDEVFRKIDRDESGFLDKYEVEAAAGILGCSLGFLMSTDMQSKAFKAMEPDEDGQITIEKFKTWWDGVQQGQLVPAADNTSLAAESAELEPPAGPSPEMLAMQAELEAAKRTIAALEVTAAAAAAAPKEREKSTELMKLQQQMHDIVYQQADLEETRKLL